MAEEPTTDRVGIHAVGLIFSRDFGWFFREQHEKDFGIDAQVEVLDEKNMPTGKLIALQVKSGPSYFRRKGEEYIYYGEIRHLNYWTNHSLPVFLILHNPDTGETLWQRIERRLVTIRGHRWSIPIPTENTLDARHKDYFEAGIASDVEAIRRFRFASDQALMEEWKDKDVYIVIEDWVNKSINIRRVAAYYDDPDKPEADLEFDIVAVRTSVHAIMHGYFPWLTYYYAEEIQDGSGEVEGHVLYVSLSDRAKAFLDLESYFRDGPDEQADPQPPLSEEEERERILHESSYEEWLNDESYHQEEDDTDQ